MDNNIQGTPVGFCMVILSIMLGVCIIFGTMYTWDKSKKEPGVLPESGENIIPALENFGELVHASIRYDGINHEEITVTILRNDLYGNSYYKPGPFKTNLSNIVAKKGWYLNRGNIIMPRSDFHQLDLLERDYEQWILNNIKDNSPPQPPANLDLISVGINYEVIGMQVV